MREDFLQFVLDQLQGWPNVSYRAMFGGYGLYQNRRFFGIIHKNRLYFKTDERTREPYVKQGMQPFRPNPSQTLKNYFEVPAEIIEDQENLIIWAGKAATV